MRVRGSRIGSVIPLDNKWQTGQVFNVEDPTGNESVLIGDQMGSDIG